MTDAEIVRLWLNTPDEEGASGFQDIIKFARAFESAIQGEPNMRHPKIQNLISQKARREIELSMIERMIDEPDFEYYGSDFDYQTNLTDKVEAFVKAARGAK